MEENRYSGLTKPHDTDESIYLGLMRVLRTIFEPWERGAGERRARGVGLGLALVRQVVERHGGRVGVTSQDPTANRFFFTLPS